MKRAVVISILAAATLGLLTAAEPSQTLGSVHKVYIMPADKGGEMIREKIVSQLVNSGKVSVANTPEESDAILTGTTDAYQGVFKLIGKSGQILWMAETTYKPNRVMNNYVSANANSQIASKAVSSLLKAIEKAKR